MAAVGNLILFFFTAIALTIIGAFFLAYVSNVFVTIIQDTAAGNDDVTWPDEPFMDWAHRVFVMLWLALIWLAPLGLILRLSKPAWLAHMPALGVTLGGLVLWAFFPVAVLSSLASESRWAFINLRIVTGMLRAAPATAIFYACSFLVVAVGLGTWIVAVLAFPVVLLPVAAVVGSICLLVYSRLLGRLALLLSLQKPLPRLRERRKPAVELPPLEIELTRVEDPWAAPKEKKAKTRSATEVMEKPTTVSAATREPPPPPPSAPKRPMPDLDDEDDDGGTYDMAAPSTPSPSISDLYDPRAKKRKAREERRRAKQGKPPAPLPEPEPAPPPRRRVPSDLDDEDEEGGTYEVTATQAETPKVSEMYLPPNEPTRVDAGAPRPRPKIKAPKRPMSAGVYSFPFYTSTRSALIGGAIGGLAVGLLLQATIALFPF